MSAAKLTDNDYMKLIRKFPLMRIHSKEQLKAAAGVIDQLAERLDSLGNGEREYFDILCDLVKQYESKIYSKLSMTAREVLQYLMEENNLSQTDLVPILRHKSHLSAFLNGKRGLSKVNAIKLGEYFKVSPLLFLQ